MRILMLSQWCWPEPETRIFSLAAALVRRAHKVTILTGFPNYPQGRIYPSYKVRLWQQEEHEGVRIVRLPLYPDHSHSVLKRVLNYLSFTISATLLGPILCGSADVLWVYHPPLTIAIPAFIIALVRRLKFVYEIQDIWPDTLIATGVLTSPTATAILRILARLVFWQATALTVISPGFKRIMVEKGVPEEKVFVISNWAAEDIFRPVPRNPALGEKYDLTNYFNILFTGNMGPAQALETVIEAAALLTDLPSVKFSFVGDGLSVDNLKAQADAKGLSNIQFIGRQPISSMADFHAWGDALLVQLREDPLFHITIPSKTLAYLASGRPILCAVPGDGADVVREANAGLVCQPGDPQALADMVRKLYKMPAVEREALGQNGRQKYLSTYSRQALTDQYEAVFRQVIASREA